MLDYLIRRTITMMFTLAVTSVLIFIIIHLPPGDYLSTYIAELQSQGEMVDNEKIEFLRRQYGLDKSMPEQYFTWATGLLQGDLGYSFEYDLPVSEVVGDRLLLSMILNFTTIIFIYLVAFPIGVYSATHQYSWGDHGLTFIGFLGLATPNFLLALVMLYFANVWFGTSIGGLMDPQFLDQPWSTDKAWSVAAHLWVPVVVIGTSGTAGMIRRLRANLLDELQKQYVVTGRAKGLSPRKLLLKYPLRMALNPFVADIGNLLPQVVSGSVIVSARMQEMCSDLNRPTIKTVNYKATHQIGGEEYTQDYTFHTDEQGNLLQLSGGSPLDVSEQDKSVWRPLKVESSRVLALPDVTFVNRVASVLTGKGVTGIRFEKGGSKKRTDEENFAFIRDNRDMSKVSFKEHSIRTVRLASLLVADVLIVGDSILNSFGQNAYLARNVVQLCIGGATFKPIRELIRYITLSITKNLGYIVICVGENEALNLSPRTVNEAHLAAIKLVDNMNELGLELRTLGIVLVWMLPIKKRHQDAIHDEVRMRFTEIECYQEWS